MIERETPKYNPLPEITPEVVGMVIRQTPNFRVVVDYKPGLEGKREGERFFIEPKNPKGLNMLLKAALAHNIYNFNLRPVQNYQNDGKEYIVPALRADYIPENLDVLIGGKVEIPKKGEDTIPSPARMEECLINHPDGYGFNEENKHEIPNPETRYLRLLQKCVQMKFRGKLFTVMQKINIIK